MGLMLCSSRASRIEVGVIVSNAAWMSRNTPGTSLFVVICFSI